MIMLRSLVALLCLSALPTPGESQTTRRLELAVSLGSASGKSSTQLINALVSSGYGDTPICPFDCPPPGARVEKEESWLASLRYAHTPRWSSSVVASAFSHTAYGYRETSQFTGEEIGIRAKMRMLAATAVLVAGPLSVEAGPALYQLSADKFTAPEPQSTSSSKIGAVAGMRLTAPVRSIVSIYGIAQYRLVGSADIGPFSTESGSMPTTSIDFNHVNYGVGLAFRF